jgi:hypothetical protein
VPARLYAETTGTTACVRTWLARFVFLTALAAWAWGVALIVTGDVQRGMTIGLPAAFVLLVYAWIKAGFWLPDGGGGP